MAFQATKWSWKGLAARLLLVPVLAGSAAGVVSAQSAPADKARALVAQANQSMQQGDLAAAEKYAKQAQMLKASLAVNEPRPENVLAEIQRRKQSSTTAPAAVGQAPTPAADPKELVKLAKQSLAAGQLDQAQDYANRANQAATAKGGKWGLFEDTPASVMKDVQQARAKADKTRSEQLFKDAKATYAKAAKTDAEKMANLEQAMHLAYQAKNLHGPYTMWEIGDKPDKLISDIESAKAQLRKKMPAAAETVARTPAPAAKAPAAKTPAGPVVPVAGTGRPTDTGKVTTAGLTTPKPAAPAALPAAKAPAMPVAPVMPAVAASPSKTEVAKLVADGRTALAGDRVLEAKAKATEARRMADEKGLSTAFGPNEDSPEALHLACQAKGREMIAALTTDAQRQTGAKKFAEAEAALEYAQQLSEGLGLYSKPIEEQRAMVATLSGKSVPAAVAPAVPAADPIMTASGTPILPPPEPSIPIPGGLPPLVVAAAPKPTPPAPVAVAPKPTPPAAVVVAPKPTPVKPTPTKPAAEAIIPVTPPAPAVVAAPKAPPPAPVAAPPMVLPAMPSPTAPAVVVKPATPPPAAPAAPAVAVAPIPTPTPVKPPVAAPAPPAVNLIDQAHAELRRGDLQMAREIAIKAHNSGPAMKADAEKLLRQIDAEDFAVKQKNAKMAFDSGMSSYAAKRYDAALGVFKVIDPSHLPADQKGQLDKLMADCAAKSAPAAAAVTLASDNAPGVARIGGGAEQKPAGDSLADQQKAIGEVGYQKLRQDGFDALNAATAAWGRGETDAAIQALTDYAARVKASNQSPSRQGMLLRPVEQRVQQLQLMKHHTDFLTKEAKDKSDVRKDQLTANVAEAQKQDEIKRKVKQVNELTKAQKFKEAELAAAQAKQLDPDDPTLTYIAEQTKNRRRMEDFKGIRSDQERFNLAALNEAERTGPAATIQDPVVVNPEAMMRAAKRGEETYLRARTPQEQVIENRLSAPFTFKFENQSLRSVIDEIGKKASLNIVTDDAAIDDEKVSLTDVMITEQVKDLSLRDGLTILLGKARLAFVIENNVIKVTSEKRSKGRMTTKVFHVMDLVTPIPEYKPADHHRLDTSIAAGRGMIPNALGGAVSGAGSMGPIAREPAGGLPGAQMVSSGTGVSGTGGSAPFLGGAGSLQNNLQSQPTAMSPLRGQYADQLKKLITGMVRPYAWQAMGGPGNIEYYDIGGALVVNQTADVIREVQDLLEALRRLQDLSVAVEVRVISLSEAFFERVGVDFQMNIKTHNTTFEQMVATSSFRPEPFLNDINNKNVLTGWNPATGGFTRDLDIPIRATSYAMTVPPFGGYQGALSPTLNGGLGLGLAFLNDIQVYMFLEAAQGNRRVNVMQAPKITLFNGQTATVFVGDVAYFTTGLSVFNVGGQFVYIPSNIAFPIGQGIDPNTGQQGGVSVTVQAVISADRRFVRLNLSPTLTALASATVPLFPVSTFITPVFEGGSQGQPVPFTQFFQQPSFSEITAQTTVAVPDGGTVLLGGLKTLAQARNEFGPPVISHIPYLNRLFKNVGVGQETRHVMMMVTPRIIINSEEEARQVGEGGGLLPPQQ